MFAWVTAGSNEPGVHCGSGRGPARKWQVPIFIESVTCFGSCTASNPPLRGSTDPFEVAAVLADAPLDARCSRRKLWSLTYSRSQSVATR